MTPENTTYATYVKGKSAEEILASTYFMNNNMPYLLVAAQVRTNEALISELKKASDDSGIMARRIGWLTLALVFVGIVQAFVAYVHK